MEFSNTGEQTEVVPRARADLPWTLTGDTAVWIESKEPSSGAYHLHHPRGDKNCPAIEYINKDWFYLNKEKGKYYTGPLSRITAPNTLGLGTYRTPSPTATPILESSTEMPSESENSRERGEESLQKEHKQSEVTPARPAESTHLPY